MRRSLATQVALVTTLVAVLSVIVAGAIAVPLARQAAERQAQQALQRQADVVADTVERSAEAGRELRLPRLRAQLQAQGIVLRLVPQGGTAQVMLTPAEIQRLQTTGRLSTARRIDGARWLVEARVLGADQTLVLQQPIATARGAVGEGLLIQRLLLALLMGLGIGASAGVLLARRLAKPLQRSSQAAQRLATGARDVRLEPEGAREVAELADALNQLAAALEVSEGRQRDFLLSVSHELRTPLTAVKGYAEALADGVVPADEVAHTGATVLDESRRLERLVSDLLDLARFGAQDLRLDLSEVDLAALVRDAGTVWSDRAERVGVEYRVEAPDSSILLRTDPTRLRQIIDNLSENALRVTPSGAPIVLALRREPGTVIVEVRDGGPGLTPDDLVVAFQPAALFTRYKGVRKVGSGVGLALVGTLATRLGGIAEAGTAPEGGARFAVRLPASLDVGTQHAGASTR